MEYISSDTNVWIDFSEIEELELPFLLPFIYLMNDETVEDELLNPPGLSERLLSLGLQKTELSEAEFFLAEEYKGRYSNPSIYDCIALAIAKVRGIILLTGDLALRKAAKAEGVDVMGTIGVLDCLHESDKISSEKYADCLNKFLEKNGGKIRLPKRELEKRLHNLKK